jgi:hypothetical protein
MDSMRNTLADIIAFDFLNNIWIPIAQTGFIPTDEELLFGRYNFSMEYETTQNQLIIFGGQSNKGTFCRPILQVFQLPNWLVTQQSKEYQIMDGALSTKVDLKVNIIQNSVGNFVLDKGNHLIEEQPKRKTCEVILLMKKVVKLRKLLISLRRR